MQRQRRVLIPVLLFIATMAGCDSCDDDSPTFPTSLVVNPAGPLSMQVGQSTVLQAVGTSSKNGPTLPLFDSSAPGVATVDSFTGRVTCVTPGTATITVKTPDLTKTVEITCTAAPLIDVTPTTVPFTHSVGVTACPQKIGTLRITNLSSAPVSVTVTPSNPAIALDATTATVPAGGSADIGVSFNCSVQNSFSATIAVVATAGGVTDSKTVAVQGTVSR